MSEQQRVTNVFSEDRQPITVRLTRGAKAQYRWDITAKAATLDRAIELIKCADRRLRELFLQSPKMEVHIASGSGDVSKDSVHSRMDQTLKNAREADKKLVENEGGFR